MSHRGGYEMTNRITEQLPELGLPKLLFRLWRRLHPRRRKQSLGVLVMMIVGGLAEVISIGAVIPFVTVLVSPERVLQIAPVSTLARILGLEIGRAHV